MYRQQGHTIHPLQLPKSSFGFSGIFSNSISALELFSNGGTPNIVIKLISTLQFTCSYHSYFILFTNSILRPKCLNSHQSELIHTTPRLLYSHTQQQCYDTTLHSLLYQPKHQPIVKRPHIHGCDCIYAIGDDFSLFHYLVLFHYY